jgi:hypothetical protein
MRLAVGLILLSLSTASAEQGPDPARLSARLHLMRQGGVFLESSGDALEVFAGGWKVKRFPAHIVQISRGKPSGTSQAAELAPVNPVPAVVIDSAEVAGEAEDTDADVSTLDQIIGVDKMPDAYVAYFDDGSIWVVNPGDWFGFSRLWRKGKLQFHMAARLVRQVIDEQGFRITFLSMDSAAARHLYWILDEQVPVVQ